MRQFLNTATGIAWAGMLLASPALPAAGESDEGLVDEIVVVASRAARSVHDVAANVTILSDDEMDADIALSLADALRYTPGVDYEGAGTRFGTEGFNIRGIGGNRVALLFDGVPLSDQFDIGSFSNATRDLVDAGFVRRAEILHGPASALYGSSAIGGVVAMRSPEPREVTGGGPRGGTFATAWRGADESLHGTALQAFVGDRLGAVGGVAMRDGSEFESAAAAAHLDRLSYRKESAFLRLVGEPSAGQQWFVGWYAQDTAVRSSLASMLGGGRFRFTSALAGDDAYRLDLANVGYEWRPGGIVDSVAVRAYAGATDIEQRTLDERALAARPVAIDRLFTFAQDLRGIEASLQATLAAGPAEHRIGAGIDFRRRGTAEYRDGLETGIDDGEVTSVILGESFPLRDFPLSDTDEFGLYVEDSVSAGRWTIIGALRADRYRLRARTDPVYAGDNPATEPVSLADAELSPKVGVVFRPTASLDLFAQYAHGFRAPPYEDANIGLDLPLFNVRAIPNPALRSERSDGLEAGLRWQSGEAALRLGLFRTTYEDFIESKVRLGADPATGVILFQSQNVHEAVIDGVEAGWQFAMPVGTGLLQTDGELYRARGRNRSNGSPLNSVGPAQAVLGLGWSADDNWYVRLRATLTDGWTDLDQAGGPLFQAPGSAVFDLYLGRTVGERLRVRGGITNLADRTWWAWSDVRGLAPDDPVLPQLARPGRGLVLGLDLDW